MFSFAVIKYQEGWIPLPNGQGICPSFCFLFALILTSSCNVQSSLNPSNFGQKTTSHFIFLSTYCGQYLGFLKRKKNSFFYIRPAQRLTSHSIQNSTTHLEELCFWLYLIHSGPLPTPWFKSAYFRLWLGGIICSIVILFPVTISTRADPLRVSIHMNRK